MTRPLRLVGMLSGGGRTLLNLLDAIDRGELEATLVEAIASRHGAPGIARLQARGVPVQVIARRDLPDDDARHDAIDRVLAAAAPDLVCLGGWLSWVRISPALRHRVLNIHPSLLPDFGGPGMHGRHVHEAVLAAGRTESGCTVHLVDEIYDHGPILVQRRCPVHPADDPETLGERVFLEECKAYPEALRLYATGVLVPGRAPAADFAGRRT